MIKHCYCNFMQMSNEFRLSGYSNRIKNLKGLLDLMFLQTVFMGKRINDNIDTLHCCFLLLLFIQKIKLGWALFVTYTVIQSIMRSEMCSLHLTHPSVHTWSSGQPTVQRPGSSRGLPVGAGIWTHNLGLPRVSSPTLYPLGQRLPW